MRKTLTALLFLPLAACSLGTPQNAPSRYRLEPQAETSPAPKAKVGVLQIARPVGAFGLDSERIQVERGDFSVSHAQDAAWVAPLPDMLQAILRDNISRNGAFSHVVDSQANVQVNALLYTTLERFTIHYDNAAPTADVKITAQVISQPRGNVIDSFTLSREIPATENRLSAIIAAFNQATVELSEEIAQRAEHAMRANPPQRFMAKKAGSTSRQGMAAATETETPDIEENEIIIMPPVSPPPAPLYLPPPAPEQAPQVPETPIQVLPSEKGAPIN